MPAPNEWRWRIAFACSSFATGIFTFIITLLAQMTGTGASIGVDDEVEGFLRNDEVEGFLRNEDTQGMSVFWFLIRMNDKCR